MTGTGLHRGWRHLVLTAALVGFGLALAGIGGRAAAAGPTAQASKVSTVNIANFAFKPGSLTVGVGSKVIFSNRSKVSHTATREGSFDTGVIAPGKSATVAFKHKGTFAYECMIHPSMHGKIIVE